MINADVKFLFNFAKEKYYAVDLLLFFLCKMDDCIAIIHHCKSILSLIALYSCKQKLPSSPVEER